MSASSLSWVPLASAKIRLSSLVMGLMASTPFAIPSNSSELSPAFARYRELSAYRSREDAAPRIVRVSFEVHSVSVATKSFVVQRLDSPEVVGLSTT